VVGKCKRYASGVSEPLCGLRRDHTFVVLPQKQKYRAALRLARYFLSLYFFRVRPFQGGALSFSAAGISRRTGIGGVRRGQTEENDCRGMLASTKNLSAKSRYHKNLAMSRINLQGSCYN
jgi:hypothetical protein